MLDWHNAMKGRRVVADSSFDGQKIRIRAISGNSNTFLRQERLHEGPAFVLQNPRHGIRKNVLPLIVKFQPCINFERILDFYSSQFNINYQSEDVNLALCDYGAWGLKSAGPDFQVLARISLISLTPFHL